MATMDKSKDTKAKDIESDQEESEIESDVESEEEKEEEVPEEEEEEEEAEEEEEESEVESSEAESAEEEDEDIEPKEKKTKGKKTSKKIVSQIESIEKLEASNKKATVTQYDSDEEDETNYLQKFDSKMRENFIADHHPEARTHNYEEVKALSRVSRDGRGIIIDPLHKTIPFLTKYEMTRIVGQRAKQLDNGAKAFVKVPINVVDGYQIALLELEQKKLPFIIKRPYPNGGVEYWNVSDLEVLI